jgi:hypothetical protein
VPEKRGKATVKKPSMTRTYSFLKDSVHSPGSKLINCFTVSSNVICIKIKTLKIIDCISILCNLKIKTYKAKVTSLNIPSTALELNLLKKQKQKEQKKNEKIVTSESESITYYT